MAKRFSLSVIHRRHTDWFMLVYAQKLNKTFHEIKHISSRKETIVFLLLSIFSAVSEILMNDGKGKEDPSLRKSAKSRMADDPTWSKIYRLISWKWTRNLIRVIRCNNLCNIIVVSAIVIKYSYWQKIHRHSLLFYKYKTKPEFDSGYTFKSFITYITVSFPNE